jgi:sortase A
MDRWRRIELLSLVAALVLLTAYLAARGHGAIRKDVSLRQFERARLAALGPSSASPEIRTGAGVPPSSPDVDQRLWSESRIRAYESALQEPSDTPLAVLRIPRIRLEVPVLEGAGELVLNQGVGWIPGTSRPGETGNVGIAGHRDGFFRGLKDLSLGDAIELATLVRNDTYRVDELRIVDPEEVEVLRATEDATLTLVTCYPFYYVGKAPRRYIVRAGLADDRRRPDAGRPSASAGPPGDTRARVRERP